MIDYIKLARQAGIDVLEVESERASMWPATPEGLAKFAELVMEEAAKTCDAMQHRHADRANECMEEHDDDDQTYFEGAMVCAEDCAAAIRAMKPNTDAQGRR
jgi:hypothetical protein